MVQTALLQLEEKQESEASLEFLAVSIVDELLDIYNDYKIL